MAKGRVKFVTAGGSPMGTRSRSRKTSATRDILVAAGNKIRPGLGSAAETAFEIGKRIVGSRGKKVPRSAGMSAATQTKGKSVVYHTTGAYGGKFSKRKFGNPFKVYANKGIYAVTETTGTVSDPNCVYISYSSVDGYRAIFEIVLSLMRKLFQKKGYNITDINEELGRLSFSNAEGWKVDLTVIDEAGGVQTVAHTFTTVAGSTLRSIAESFVPFFREYSAGFGLIAADNAKRLQQLILYSVDYAPVANQNVFACALNLVDEIVHLKAKCELKIQNRTKAANSSTSTEDVSNNPLCGYSYRFNSQPKTRDRALFILNTVGTGSGVRLMRSNQLSGDSPYREPPLPNTFMNCISSSKQMLAPGEVKKSKITFVKSMSLLTMLKKIGLQYNVPVGAQTSNSPFPHEMFALEDLINVNASENISVAYEANHYLGVYCTTSKKATALSSFIQVTVDNLSPP